MGRCEDCINASACATDRSRVDQIRDDDLRTLTLKIDRSLRRACHCSYAMTVRKQ